MGVRYEVCASCAFWRADESEDYEYGQCRKYAPRPVQDAFSADMPGPVMWGLWPRTLCNDFCGEWEKWKP